MHHVKSLPTLEHFSSWVLMKSNNWNSEISKAQDRLTDLLQNVYTSYPGYRELVRLIMSTVGRGGEGDVGQRIRDEILVIQVGMTCLLLLLSV